MSLLKYIGRLKRMDDLIRRKATGTPDEFAERLGISKSMLMINLAEIKEMGVMIEFDSVKQTYMYVNGCGLRIEFEVPIEDMNRLKGGENSFDFFLFQSYWNDKIHLYNAGFLKASSHACRGYRKANE
jgi:Predicted transcriptional regulator